VHVYLSALLGWAWLQRNSRALRLLSAVRALRVSVSLSDCRLRLLSDHKQSAREAPKKQLRLPGERPPLLRVAPTDQGTKGRQTHALQKSHHSHWLSRTGRRDACHANGTPLTRLSLATSVSWKEKNSNEYQTRTEWHRILCWNKLAEWAGALQKGAYVEVEGELSRPGRRWRIE
jgi:Single-strand binding protein family